MTKPVFEGLLSLEGRRNRRSFAWLMVFLVALHVRRQSKPIHWRHQEPIHPA